MDICRNQNAQKRGREEPKFVKDDVGNSAKKMACPAEWKEGIRAYTKVMQRHHPALNPMPPSLAAKEQCRKARAHRLDIIRRNRQKGGKLAPRKQKQVKNDYINEPLILEGPNKTCQYCHVVVWYQERSMKSKKTKEPRFSICCGEGKDIVKATYSELPTKYKEGRYLRERAILTPKNEDVEKINSHILSSIPGKAKTYKSSDTICKASANSEEQDLLYPAEFLNSLKFSGIPNHELDLKVGSPIMLLRNMNPSKGMCNGTRLIKC
ncbi:hypothetical protein RJ639_009075 [Escallonia herrerae]|uniref:DNA helicase Pif1-like 2B domain-containing protein n=1 Tax=Escallonia herrerae TaxID=1293975 RepID=A0AA89AU62_9ASTE|nr:hypothetical protein RJ639_009075 [Escallonia herrerae]